MEYLSLAKKTLATTIAALAIATSSGCMGVGKAFTTFGPKPEEKIEQDKEKAPYAPPAKQEKQDDPKDGPRHDIKPEYQIPAESCYNHRLDDIMTSHPD